MSQIVSLSVPDELLEEVRETAKATDLSMQDVFRQSTKLGLPVLRAAAKGVPRPRRLSVWDALASGDGLNVKFPASEEKVPKVLIRGKVGLTIDNPTHGPKSISLLLDPAPVAPERVDD